MSLIENHPAPARRGRKPGHVVPQDERERISRTIRWGITTGRIERNTRTEPARFSTLTAADKEMIVHAYCHELQSSTDIAHAFGVSCVTALKWLRALNVEIRANNHPAVIAATVRSNKSRHWTIDARAKLRAARIIEWRERRRTNIEVPAWVPAPMQESYRCIALTSGEEEAAAWARAQKRNSLQAQQQGAR